jgi:hypothetical protein
MNRHQSKLTSALLAVLIALLAGNMASSTPTGATASMESVFFAQSNQPEVPLEQTFTYQGRLKDGPNPANGQYDFQFRLFDALSGGSQVGPTVSVNGRAVTEGLVTISLNFGPLPRFNGDTRYLEVAVRPTGGGSFSTLTPRQTITAAPNALYAIRTEQYGNVVVVAKSGGFVSSISSALLTITDASPTNRYLVWVGPGVYIETIQMKQYVDIVGAGEGVTKITSDGGPNPSADSTLHGANNAALRSLTVENTGGGTNAVAIYNNGDSPLLENITAVATGATSSNFAVYNTDNSSPQMKSVTAVASYSGSSSVTAIYNNSSSSPLMENVKATATNSTASGSTTGIENEANSSPNMTNVAVTASGGFITMGIFNHSNSAPALTNVTVNVTGTVSNTGIRTTDASVRMLNLNINVSATGEGSTVGLFNSDGSIDLNNVSITLALEEGAATGLHNLGAHVTMENSRIRLTNTSVEFDFGIHNIRSSLTMNNSTVVIDGIDFNDRAIRNNATAGIYNVFIDSSTLKAAVTIGNDDEFTTRLGATKLDFFTDAVVGGGTVICAGVYDDNYQFYANTCP